MKKPEWLKRIFDGGKLHQPEDDTVAKQILFSEMPGLTKPEDWRQESWAEFQYMTSNPKADTFEFH